MTQNPTTPTGGWWPRKASVRRYTKGLLLACMAITISGCEIPLLLEEDDDDASINLQPAQYAELAGWNNDDHAEALKAFLRSCEKIKTLPEDQNFGAGSKAGKAGEWKKACNDAEALPEKTSESARLFFESSFRPYLVSSNWHSTGLFTGYYEIALDGGLDESTETPVPIYGLPADLITLNLQDFDSTLPKRTLTGRLQDNKFVPYPDREQIAQGALADKPIAWGKDEVDVFFLQIQGSGSLKMADGSSRPIGYAGQNGRPYTAIGKKLIEMGAIPKEKMNAEAIKEWLRNNPDKADEVMNENKSYVFFRLLDGGIVGAQGVELIAERSLAVDKRFIPLGAPIWLETSIPPQSGNVPEKYSRLMIAQDTGGAIKGKIRGDIFFGSGERAEYLAGNMKNQGRYFMLLPVAPAS